MGRRKRERAARSAKRRHTIILSAVAVAAAAILVGVGVAIGFVASQDPEEATISIPDAISIPNDVSTPIVSEMPRISVEEVKAKLDAGSNIAIVDVRSTREYEESHIAGAISIPLQEITQRYSELDRYDEIATYCT